jgi:hypothetical protein
MSVGKAWLNEEDLCETFVNCNSFMLLSHMMLNCSKTSALALQ